MPIVTVQVVQETGEQRYASAIAKELADALGEVFDSEPGTTWVKFAYLARADYAENKSELRADARPVFVEVLKRTLAAEDALANEAMRIAECVANILSRPCDNVHVLYLPAAEGRIAFGGELVRSR